MVFLPHNYRNTVRTCFFPYCMFNALSVLFSTMCGVTSTQILLYALSGLRPDHRLVTSISAQYILKNCIGQFAGTFIGSGLSRYYDSHPKASLIVGNLLGILSFWVSVLVQVYPLYFLIIAAIANAFVNVSWIMLSAARAHIHQTMCLANNLADITAKVAFFDTFSSALGLGLGAVISIHVGNDLLPNVWLGMGYSVMQLLFAYLSIHWVTIEYSLV